MKGLGKKQKEQRKETEIKIKKFVKKTNVTYVNQIIRETRLDTTAAINGIKRLVSSGELLCVKHKNKNIIGYKNKKNRRDFESIKDQEKREERRKAQKDIVIQKMLGKLPRQNKKANKILEIYELEQKLIQINHSLQESLDSRDKENWLRLYQKRDKVMAKLLYIRNPSEKIDTIGGKSWKLTPIEKQLKLYERKMFPATIPGNSINFELI